MLRRISAVLLVPAILMIGSCAGSDPSVGRLPGAQGNHTRVLVRILDERPQRNTFSAQVNLRQLVLNRLVEEMRKRNYRPHIQYQNPESELEIQIRQFRFQTKNIVLGGMELAAALKASCLSGNRDYDRMYSKKYALSPGAVRAATTDPARIERREIERMIPRLVEAMMKDESLMDCLSAP